MGWHERQWHETRCDTYLGVLAEEVPDDGVETLQPLHPRLDERVLLPELLMHLRRVTRAWAHTGTIPHDAP